MIIVGFYSLPHLLKLGQVTVAFGRDDTLREEYTPGFFAIGSKKNEYRRSLWASRALCCFGCVGLVEGGAMKKAILVSVILIQATTLVLVAGLYRSIRTVKQDVLESQIQLIQKAEQNCTEILSLERK